MSAATRDERAEVFGYSDPGTGGRSNPTYTRLGTYWTRRGIPGMREVTIAGQASQTVDAVFEFSGAITIPGDGAVRHQDGTVYKITGVGLARGTASETDQIVLGVYADEMTLRIVDRLLLESGDALLTEDGSNLLLESAA